jgi:hypothetical protein
MVRVDGACLWGVFMGRVKGASSQACVFVNTACKPFTNTKASSINQPIATHRSKGCALLKGAF